MCRMCGRNSDASVSRRFLVIRKKGREMQKTDDASAKSIVADCSSEGMTCHEHGDQALCWVAVFFKCEKINVNFCFKK